MPLSFLQTYYITVLLLCQVVFRKFYNLFLHITLYIILNINLYIIHTNIIKGTEEINPLCLLFKDRSARVGGLHANRKKIGSSYYPPFRMPLRFGFPSSKGEVSCTITKVVAHFLGFAQPSLYVQI